jgi:hypothetical protein
VAQAGGLWRAGDRWPRERAVGGVWRKGGVGCSAGRGMADGDLVMADAFSCPCCGYLTSPGDWEVCPVCCWENDPVQRGEPDLAGGANRVSFGRGRGILRNLARVSGRGGRAFGRRAFDGTPVGGRWGRGER